MNLLIKPLKIRTRRYQKRCILNVSRGKIGEPAKQWNAMRALTNQPVQEVFMADAILCQSGIYQIRNTANGRLYVGSAVNIKRRWADHKKGLKAGTHHCKKLQNSWNKHGAECFEFSILEVVAVKGELILREQHWIDSTGAAGKGGYNVSPTAFSLLGFRHSDESKEKCRAAKVGKKMPPHVLDALRLANTGRKLAPEHIAKVAAHHIGKKKSAESIEKTASAHRGVKRSIEARSRISEAAKGRAPTFLGRQHSEESKAKISLAKKGNIPGSRKLNEAQAVEIRALRATGQTYKSIGVLYGVTGECIGNLIRGATWKA